MRRRLLSVLAACLLLTGCATQAETTPAPAQSTDSTPDMSVPSWRVQDGYLSRYIISQQSGQPLECVIYTGGGLDCNWQGGAQ
ncbi:hypothetical protein FYJ24_06955 [Actinomycetaceae bacterium WB03_NA08]|uniref:Lipoprotein n=1 Tax=Scrofimicrobium canadense TaxID=2652290 RepID=A0A6N7W8B5_9ACTO|nr:hypothetical protein [Scrofimicrobium canadense]MSS84506.1 hypothetical protein [Scrofimicrobium canadense]